MTRTKLIICLSLILTIWTARLYGDVRIADQIEQNGNWKSIYDPLTGYDPIKVVLTESCSSGEWKLEILDKCENYRSVSGIEQFEGGCIINPEILQDDFWPNLTMEYEADLNRDLFILRLSFTDDEKQHDSVILKWGLIPTRPVISDVDFNYIYDWEYDDIWPNGTFSFKVESQDAEQLEYNVTKSFQFGPPFVFTNYFLIEAPSPTVVEYDADWGEFIKVGAGNRYGFSHSDVICTTDYITDQAILDRIQEIADVRQLEESSDQLFDIDNDVLSFRTPVNIAVYDISGQQILSLRYSEEVSLATFPSGVYLIAYSTSSRSFKLKYHKK